MKNRLARAAVALLLVVPALAASPTQASTPASATLTAPDSGTVSVSWTGTVLPGSTNNPGAGFYCEPSSAPLTALGDIFQFRLALPGNFYTNHSTELIVQVDWQPAVSAAANNLFLTVGKDDGTGNTDSGEQVAQALNVTEQKITLVNPAAVTGAPYYFAGACPQANSTPQAYTGKATLIVQKIAPRGPASLTALAFAPPTIVDPTHGTAEPEDTNERRVPNSLPNAVDNKRVFVDWPYITTTQTDVLARSTDAGDSFRLIVDPTCAARLRPNCTVGGSGDSMNRVNLYDGTVYLADQEEVLAEAVSSSTDHGDTFSVQRSFAATTAATGVDRQWLAPISGPGYKEATSGTELRAMYAYHVPAAGEYVVGIDTNGIPVPPPAPQIVQVDQSGINRVDTTGGPGDGYFYQSYRDTAGFEVATVKVSDFENPAAYRIHNLSPDQPVIFPWIDLDSEGNLYAVWVTGGNVYYSTSSIHDPANNPKVGGVPASKWTPKVQVNPSQVGSTVFPEIAAGDPGRVAVTYEGTTDYKGQSDNAPDPTRWHIFTAVTTNGLSGAPQFLTGTVDHRISHMGNICTAGTTCTGDRSLADMIDVTVDQDGRPGVVFSDNNSTLQGKTGVKKDGLAKFSKMIQGPSLFATHPDINVPAARDSVTDPAGDATWPNTAAGTNLPSMDLLGASLSVQNGSLIARMKLANGSASQMQADLSAYNAGAGATTLPAGRIQYLLRFETAGEVYHLSMESLSDGTRRFFGGKIDANDAPGSQSPNPSTSGMQYHTDDNVHATGVVDSAGVLTIRADLSDFGLAEGTPVYSVTAMAMAGLTEAQEQVIPESILGARVVDATPPFDSVLGASVTGTPTPPTTGTIGTPNTSGLPRLPPGELAAALTLAAFGLGALGYRRLVTPRRHQ